MAIIIVFLVLAALAALILRGPAGGKSRPAPRPVPARVVRRDPHAPR
jgi:hypothetical protein